MMKITLFVLLLVSSTFCFAAENTDACAALAEKAALSLYILENGVSDINQLTDTSVSKVSDGKYSVQFIDNSGDTNESAIGYEVNVENFESDACFLSSITVGRAG